tara:strand:- start:460 stop:684 length:225 start_codon:yes stop_codon:yes gene_type:complete
MQTLRLLCLVLFSLSVLAACDRLPERQQRALILACSVQKQVTEGSEASDLLQACDPQSAGKEQTEDLPPDQLAL